MDGGTTVVHRRPSAMDAIKRYKYRGWFKSVMRKNWAVKTFLKFISIIITIIYGWWTAISKPSSVATNENCLKENLFI